MKSALIAQVTALAAALSLALPVAAPAQTPYEPPRADEMPRPLLPPSTQDSPQDEPSGLGSLFENGMESMFRDLLGDIEPHMNAIGRELGGRFEALAPLLQDAGELMDDLRHYQAPERLANGDILIRRKPDAPAPPPISQELQDLTKPPLEPHPSPAPAPDKPEPVPLPQIDL